MALRVGTDETDRHVVAFRALSSNGEHGLGYVDAGAVATCPEQARDGKGRTARATSHVENPPSGSDGNRFDEQVFEGREHPVEHVLRLDPAATRETVPEFRLLFIRLVHDIHRRLRPLAID